MHFSLLTLAALFVAADDAKMIRYGVAPDAVAFPQKTPQETLSSVLKSADMRRFDYLTAQLADPAFVDDRVRRVHGGRFNDQVEDTRTCLDAPTLALFRRFLKDGAWQVGKDNAIVSLKDISDRIISFRLVGSRWFMEHRNK